MGIKAKKAMKKQLRKASSKPSPKTVQKKEAKDYMPLDGTGSKLEEKLSYDKATVVYVGRIPHGFYEDQMRGYFSQFGIIKRLRISRNKKTGKSKHYGFIEFESPEVAKIVADCMNNYLLFEHLLKVELVAPENVHPKIWRGFNYRYKPVDYVQLERKNHNKEKTLEEHKKMVDRIVKREKKRQRRIEAAGIDYECPEIIGSVQPAPKKIKFDED